MNHKLAIIGAGSSGISACKAAQDAGIDYVCFEKGSYVGGNWVFNNDNGQTSCYQSLHINTSARMMAYQDNPMPEHYPDFPHHSQMASYFDSFARKHGLSQHIRFNQSVMKVDKLEDGRYRITTDTGNVEKFDAVIVANGHHWKPKEIKLPGNYTGKLLHSHFYKKPEIFNESDHVLVVGFGNSAIDIACEASRNTLDPVVLSTRSQGWIFPKYLMGKPLDQVSRPAKKWLPQKLQMILYLIKMMISIRLTLGKQEKFGVPKPNRHLFSDHPTISSELLYLSGHGKVKVHGGIKNINGKLVEFDDGYQQEFDTIVLCTGYDIAFPFLDSLVTVNQNNEVELYHRVVDPNNKNLFFIGLIQPIGPVMPIAELQSQWIMKLIRGEVGLPDTKTMHAAIAAKKEIMKKNLKHSPRHSLEERFYPYIELMSKLIYPKNKKAQKQVVQSFVLRAKS